MTAETTTTDIIVSEPKNLEALELLESKRSELKELAKSSEGLKIKWVDDKDGYALVHAQEQKLVKARVYLEKTRKEYTAQFDARKKSAIELEKELVSIISPAEDALKAEKARIAELKEQARIEAERKAKEKLNHRVTELARVNATHDLFDLEMMEESDFIALLSEKETAFNAEQARIAKEAEEKEKYEKERAEFEAEKAKLEAEKQAMEAEKNKIAREAELKKAQEEAAEKARIETEARMKREAEEAEAKRIAEEKAKADQEAKERAELESQKKFIDWLAKNGVTAENKADFEVRNENGVKVLWKRVSTYQA